MTVQGPLRGDWPIFTAPNALVLQGIPAHLEQKRQVSAFIHSRDIT